MGNWVRGYHGKCEESWKTSAQGLTLVPELLQELLFPLSSKYLSGGSRGCGAHNELPMGPAPRSLQSGGTDKTGRSINRETRCHKKVRGGQLPEAADCSRGRPCLFLSLVLLFAGCVALGKLLSLSEPQVFYLSSGDNGTTHKCV